MLAQTQAPRWLSDAKKKQLELIIIKLLDSPSKLNRSILIWEKWTCPHVIVIVIAWFIYQKQCCQIEIR